jgi:hypothetical protein
LQAWIRDYYDLSDLCHDDYETIATVIKKTGYRYKRAYLMQDLENGRMEKHADIMNEILSMDIKEFRTLLPKRKRQTQMEVFYDQSNHGRLYAREI